MTEPRKAVALISGGLDSLLAARVIMDVLSFRRTSSDNLLMIDRAIFDHLLGVNHSWISLWDFTTIGNGLAQ